MIAEGKQVIFPKDLITTPELADFKKNSPAVFEYVKAKLKQDLNYNIDPKAKLTAEEKKEKRDIIFTDKNFKNSHIYI